MQKAIVAALKAGATGPLVGGRIYDGVPGEAVKPYVWFGPFQLLPEHGDCLERRRGVHHAGRLVGDPRHLVTVEVKTIGAAIAADLDLADIELEAPQRLVELTIEQTQYMRDPDGITAHGVITVHAWTEPTI